MAYSGNYCARWQDLLPVFALNNPLGEEAAPLREHLETCAACRREVEALREALALLPHGLAPVAPRPETRESLMSRVRMEAGGVPFGMGVPISASVPRAPPAAAPPPPRRRVGLFVAFAASFCAMLATGALALREHRRWQSTERDLAQLRAALTRAQAAAEERGQALAKAEALTALLRARSVQLVSLTPPETGEGEITGRIYWDREHGVWLFVAFALPPPPPDRDYQLWFLTKGAGKSAPTVPVSAGLLAKMADGNIEGRIEVPKDLSGLTAAAVTLEPKGGAAQPTGVPVLLGEI